MLGSSAHALPPPRDTPAPNSGGSAEVGNRRLPTVRRDKNNLGLRPRTRRRCGDQERAPDVISSHRVPGAGMNPRPKEIITYSPHVRAGQDDHPAVSVQSHSPSSRGVRKGPQSLGPPQVRVGVTRFEHADPELESALGETALVLDVIRRRSRQIIFASLSRSLIRLRPAKFVVVREGCDGAGGDAPDGGRTVVGRPRKRVSKMAACNPADLPVPHARPRAEHGEGRGTRVPTRELHGREGSVPVPRFCQGQLTDGGQHEQ
jgi:hypothetical protein